MPISESELHEQHDRQARGVKALLLGAISTLGAPKRWAEVIAVVIPILVDMVSSLIRATHPDSPSGSTITRAEVKAIAASTGQALEEAILGHYLSIGLVAADAVVEEEKPSAPSALPPDVPMKAAKGKKADPTLVPGQPVDGVPTDPAGGEAA